MLAQYRFKLLIHISLERARAVVHAGACRKELKQYITDSSTPAEGIMAYQMKLDTF